ncbi:MAG: peptide ABC transporter substrate-binding protein [Crocinitomicaceae bacterium]|nr:peptide ABC transporter substrate-binding protein [Crocinitomicaceae bacterium]
MKGFQLILMFSLLLTACDGFVKKQAIHEGGTFRMAIEANVSTTIPRSVIDYYSEIVLNQMYEGLVSLDPESLQVRPQIAESYKISRDALTYSFVLRRDVLFHPNPVFVTAEDRLLTGQDVLHSFELICSKDQKDELSRGYAFIFKDRVVGAEEFYAGNAKTIEGITLKDGVLSIELIEPDPNFLLRLASINASITSKKMFLASKEKELVGTGPFRYNTDENKSKNLISLVRNEDYYMTDKSGHALPYLDALNFIIEPSKEKQLALFEENKTDFILSIPASGITSILEGRIQDFNSVPPKLELRSNPLLMTNYYFFNMQEKRFQNPKVRQAFNHAINRREMVVRVLYNQVQDNGMYGIVPPLRNIVRNYDFDQVKNYAYTYDLEKAQKLLAEAGFPEGKGFGEIVFKTNSGDIHLAIAQEFAKQIEKNLGIKVRIVESTFEEQNRAADHLDGDIFRTAWYADYNSPESFLQNFYGKVVPADTQQASPINQARYVNVHFDNYYERALRESKISNQMKYFSLAEIELLKDPPMMVLWYAEDNQVLYSNVRNLKENPLNQFIFREVYLKDMTKEEYKH